MNVHVLAASVPTPHVATSGWIMLLIGIILGFIIARRVG